MSLTVRTAAISRPARTSLKRVSSDELNAATRCILRFQDPLHEDRFATYGFARNDGIESRAEWILTEYTNGKGVALGRRGSGRPFDEPGEVVQVGCLHLKFSGFRFLGGRTQRAKDCSHDNQSNHPRQKTLLAPERSTLWRGLATTCGAILPHGCPCWSPSPSDLRVDAPPDLYKWTRVPIALCVMRLKQVLSDYGKFKRPGRMPTQAYIAVL
jgi:hypothetical protein